MLNVFSYGFMAYVSYVLFYVVTGGNTAKAFHLLSLLAENWLNASVAALHSLSLI